MSAPRKAIFRSLNGFNYRMWAGGALVSNVGTWMQRIALDWLVLTQLTHNNATVVGVVMALQFGPHILLLPWTGFAADRLDRRKLLIATQAAMGALALALGVLTIAGQVELWQVYVFAFAQGCVTAFDAPARQTFVAELVGDADLANAVALNSTSFNAARMIGPAVAGVLIAAIGSRLGVCDQRCLVRRRARLAQPAAPRRTPSERAGRANPRQPRRRISLCLEPARSPGDPADAFSDRHIRAEFPDLHSDHGGRRLSRRRGPIWAADVDHGDRHDRRRAARRRTREARISGYCSWARQSSEWAARWRRSCPITGYSASLSSSSASPR